MRHATVEMSAVEALSPVTTRSEISGWRRVVMIGAPLLVGSLLVLHPNGIGLSADEWVQLLVSIRQRFMALHIVLLPLWPVLGVILFWMLPQRGTASRISRIALAAYVILYPAFDALVGIGSSFLADYRMTLSGSGQAVVDPAIALLFFDPTGVPELLATAASVAWTVAALAAAVSLWRPAGWRVAVPLTVSGVLMGWGHTWPMGPLANLALAAAAWQFLVVGGSAQKNLVGDQPATEVPYAAEH
jgi:hypothetical protein